MKIVILEYKGQVGPAHEGLRIPIQMSKKWPITYRWDLEIIILQYKGQAGQVHGPQMRQDNELTYRLGGKEAWRPTHFA